MEKNIGASLKISYVCEKFAIKRRIVYDFISIYAAFNVCRRYESDLFEWYGLKSIQGNFSKIKESVKEETRPLISAFSCADDCSLPTIAKFIVSLFFYLSVKCLDLREACALLSAERGNYKTILRKIYTVAMRLEVGKIVSKTKKVAEIRLIDWKEDSHFSSFHIRSFINTAEELNAHRILMQRRQEYDRIVSQKSFISSSQCSSSPTTPGMSSATSSSPQVSSPESNSPTEPKLQPDH